MGEGMERGSKEGWYYTVLKYTQLLQAYRDGMGEVRGMVWERYETKSRGLLQN